MEDRKIVVRRLALLMVIAGMVVGLYVLRMVFLQLIRGDEFVERATNTTEYRFTVAAARGDIVDSYGRRIATNTTCHNVVLSKLLIGDRDVNETLQEAVRILQSAGEGWNDGLLVSQPDAAGHYTFTNEPGSASGQRALDNMLDALGLQQYATADDVMEKLVADYHLEEYDRQWQRILGGLRFQMTQEAFSNVNNFTLAENVSDKTVATIKERSLTLRGVDIVETSTRSYPDGTVLPHVVGRVGKITAERWKVTDENGQVTYPLREKGYAMNDIIGISGLESVYEEALRGADGVLTVTRDADGAIIDTSMTTEPRPGQTVMLTINSDFQKAVDEALERNIQWIAAEYGRNGPAASAGAVVVIDVKTGAILAASNYPSYDQNLYSTNYGEYNADPGLPLYNRALQGLYTPGSTYKPSVAIAGMLSGTVTGRDTVYCNGIYTFYKDYQPRCTRHGHSGNIDLVTAIKWSCNCYFYDVGRRTTTDVYDSYARQLGLGVRTGVEVGESMGRLTTKEDSNYTPGLELQGAIGQGNTVLTPVQLATYAATIANHGVRYKTHFVKALLDTNTGEVIEEIEPEIVDVIEDDRGAFDLVEQGMVGMSQTVSALANYPYTLACKTGTPQRPERDPNDRPYTNSMMIAYGPVEDPQIAIGIAIEYGGGGSRVSNLVVDIFNAYFFEQSNTMQPVQEGTLLE